MLTAWKLSYKCNGVSWDSGTTCLHDDVPTYPKGAILKLSVISLLHFKICEDISRPAIDFKLPHYSIIISIVIIEALNHIHTEIVSNIPVFLRLTFFAKN